MKLVKSTIEGESLVHAYNYIGYDNTLCGVGQEDAELFNIFEGKSKNQITCEQCFDTINGILKDFK